MDTSSSLSTKLSTVQLRDVQDTLRRPLTGRQVLIPLGPKAFVAGRLAPTLRGDEETIQLRSEETGELQTVARKEAIDSIQREIKALQPSKAAPAKSSLKKHPPPSSSSEPSPKFNAEPNQPAPSFFEIREELDEQGQEVHSEAVDITNEQSPQKLMAAREKIYELLVNCIPADIILKTLVRELTRNLDDTLKAELFEWAAFYEHRIALGSKEIFHLEAFIAKYMAIYKKYLNELFA